MSESVAMRLREQKLKGQVISLYLQDLNLKSFRKQIKINQPTFLSSEIIKVAMSIFKNSYTFSQPVRNTGIKVSNLYPANSPHQINFFSSEKRKQKTIPKATRNSEERPGRYRQKSPDNRCGHGPEVRKTCAGRRYPVPQASEGFPTR